MKKIVIYGDSIAAGLYNGEETAILDENIQDELEKKGFSDVEVVNLGVRGASTASALEKMDTAVMEQPDIFVLNVGINDAINIRDNQADYQENLQKMIHAFSAEKVILVGPSYVDESIKTQTDPAILQEYRATAKKTAEANNVSFIDVYHYMTLASPKDYLQEDGLHPSKSGYQLLGELIAEEIKNKWRETND